MSEYVTKTYLKDFLMHILPMMYKQKIDSFRRIMEAMIIYQEHGMTDRNAPENAVQGITPRELENAHMLVEAAGENDLLSQILARLVTARGRSDKDVIIAIDWVSNTVTDDTIHPEDDFYYNRALAAWEENFGPEYSQNADGDEMENVEKDIPDVKNVEDKDKVAEGKNTLGEQKIVKAAAKKKALSGNWNMADYIPGPPAFPNPNQSQKCSKRCNKSEKGQLTIAHFRLKVSGGNDIYKECYNCMEKAWAKKGNWKPVGFR